MSMRYTVREASTLGKKKKNKNAMNKTKQNKTKKQKESLSSRLASAERILMHFFAAFLLTTTWTRYVIVRFGFAK